jgi:hypothetical protein
MHNKNNNNNCGKLLGKAKKHEELLMGNSLNKKKIGIS